MKYLVVSFILFLSTLQTFSQQEYFIYLQTDNSQPFYIRINNNVYSSASSGYLILSKLPDSTAIVTIGFPKNVFPEQQFNIPVNRKDAGYTIKNFGDKGWGLFNLQTMAVIMNTNPVEEKKSPEITGTKRNDPFSLLLANAVNDTAVLYTVNRPQKPAPAPVIIAAEEKKKDTLSLVKENLSKKDSIAFVKKLPEKTDSTVTAKNTNLPVKDTAIAVTNAAHLPKTKPPSVTAKNRKAINDSIAAAKKIPLQTIVKDTAVAVTNAPHLPKTKPPAATAKNRKAINDSIAAAKKMAPQITVITAPKNTTGPIKDSILIVKTGPNQKKDTIIMGNTHLPASRETATAKNKNERKDTIILMKGKALESNQPVAKNIPVKKEKNPLTEQEKDTIQLKKEILIAPEEKRNALSNNKDAVVIQKIPVKKDSVTKHPAAKKDTIEILAKNEILISPAEKKDTIADIPVRRLRPLVNKAAEVFTDTSYVAVFVDESKDKFDTIRISIPFDEVTANIKQEKPAAVKPTDTANHKIIKSSIPVTPAAQAVTAPEKNDTATADKIVKVNTVPPVTQQNMPPAVKTDTVTADKKAKDSAAASVTQQIILPPVKTDTTAGNKAVKDSLAAITREPTPITAKKDSVTVPPDSARTVKNPPQPIFLNSDCKETAQDNDIDKLRIKMLLMVSDEDRINVAKKVFRQKCFLVKQVMALSELFRTDEGKYKWFDVIYPFVSDSGNFYSLVIVLKDSYYINRFNAMLRN